VCPSELRKLKFVMTAFQVHDKKNKPENVNGERNESMMCRKWEQKGVDVYRVFKVVNDTFSVQEIIRCKQEIPI
jgi:pyruvate/oxaloacetate carboxyltransferase